MYAPTNERCSARARAFALNWEPFSALSPTTSLLCVSTGPLNILIKAGSQNVRIFHFLSVRFLARFFENLSASVALGSSLRRIVQNLSAARIQPPQGLNQLHVVENNTTPRNRTHLLELRNAQPHILLHRSAIRSYLSAMNPASRQFLRICLCKGPSLSGKKFNFLSK